MQVGKRTYDIRIRKILQIQEEFICQKPLTFVLNTLKY